MLEKFRKEKEQEIIKLLNMVENGTMPEPYKKKRLPFGTALFSENFISVIAEYKRASPSRGVIRDDLDIETVACQYSTAKAAAISILTEENWFQGDIDFINRASNVTSLPILRKDFIFHPLQILATAATPASALLLIARMLPDSLSLGKLIKESRKYGLECVVEVFNQDDLNMARDSGATLIQVNARDLNSLKVDRSLCIDLINKNPPLKDEIWIAASGMDSSQHLNQAYNSGFSAVLIGTTLMKHPHPGKALELLLAGK